MTSFIEFLQEQNKLLYSNKDIAKFDKSSGDDRISKLKAIYDDIFPEILKRQRTFVDILKSTSKKYTNSEIKTRIKPLDSVISKVINRNKKLKDMPDLLGGMIIVQYNDEVEDVVKDLQRKYGNYIVKIDRKTLGTNRSGYHGAVHIDMDIDGILAEVQVLTKNLNKNKKLAHRIYSKTRDVGASEEDLANMRKFFIRGMRESLSLDESVLMDDSGYVVLDSLSE